MRIELSISHENLRMPKPDDTLIIWDSKRSAEINCDSGTQMKPPLLHLPDNKYWAYGG